VGDGSADSAANAVGNVIGVPPKADVGRRSQMICFPGIQDAVWPKYLSAAKLPVLVREFSVLCRNFPLLMQIPGSVANGKFAVTI
jgi:hypothetical protein